MYQSSNPSLNKLDNHSFDMEGGDVDPIEQEDGLKLFTDEEKEAFKSRVKKFEELSKKP